MRLTKDQIDRKLSVLTPLRDGFARHKGNEAMLRNVRARISQLRLELSKARNPTLTAKSPHGPQRFFHKAATIYKSNMFVDRLRSGKTKFNKRPL